MELGDDTSLRAGLRNLDYSATRTYKKGDELLYRPLLFSLLGLENTLFGRDYRAWNITNLGIHLATACGLFELLWCIQPSLFAAAFALLFSVITANFELVVWNHLGGYILGYGLLLLALLAARRLTYDGQGAPPGVASDVQLGDSGRDVVP